MPKPTGTKTTPRRVRTTGAPRSVFSSATMAVSVQSILLALLAGGCSAGAADPPANSPEPLVDTGEAETGFYPRNEISRAEIIERRTDAKDAMGVVRRLRPAWLQARGTAVVYVDNMRQQGGLGALFNIPIGQIRLMEFIGAADATTRWGTGHMGGVIRVLTGR